MFKIDYLRNNTIWFDQIPEFLFFDQYLQEVKLNEMIIQDIEYLILRHYKSKLGNFVDMPIPESLLYLEFR